ncbi:MAG: hypothetical protein ACK5ZZ_13435 [Gemmatimonadaceae bacterium]
MNRAVREALQLTALGVVVTARGLVTGAFIMSPAVSREQRLLAVAGVAAAAALVALAFGLRRAVRELQLRRSRVRTTPAAAPAIWLGGKAGRTPRAVQALAAAGAEPTEIAWKTGLPVDAVSMLLELGGPASVSR